MATQVFHRPGQGIGQGLVGGGHVVQGAMTFDMVQGHTSSAGKGSHGTGLVQHEVVHFLRRNVHRAPTETHQVW